jgi:hypothetical protein
MVTARFLAGFVLAAGFVLTASAQRPTPGVRGVPEKKVVVNFTEVAEQQPAGPPSRQLHRPLRPAFKLRSPVQAVAPAATEPAVELALAPSPPVTASFLAVLDDDTAIPPDTMGAVGPNHVMTTLNSQARIQNRSGAKLSTVSLNSFWASLGGLDVFDPRVTYDPMAGRWVFSAVANSELPSASVLIGVSATSDPTGQWFLYRVDVDPDNLVWADFDSVGFNKDWIVVSANIFHNQGGFLGVWLWVFDKADLYANGAGTFTLLKTTSQNAFTLAPAQTYDNTLATLYLVEDWDGSVGQLRVSAITGAVGAEVLTVGTALPTTTHRWDYLASDDFAPQLGATRGIDAGDSRILSCSYRNGSLWVAQTAFVPFGAPTRSVAQWWQFLPDGTVQQFGRVEDPTGNQFFAYPSLAANASNDVLLGYSRFSALQYASANYSFRFGNDPPGTMRADTVLKAGEGAYVKVASKLNRWGDYSATCVDPLNDLTLWSIQEYAAASNRWSTWWGRVDPDLSALKLRLTRPADGISYPSNATVTLVATPYGTNTFTKVEFYADDVKIGESVAAPYTVTWAGAGNGGHTLFAVGAETGGGAATTEVAIVSVGDSSSPIGAWETKLSGPNKGTAVISFNDDFTVSGHGMIVSQFGLVEIAGVWNFDSKRQTESTYAETLGGNTLFSGKLLAKLVAGRKLTATVTPGSALTRLRKLKAIPRAPVPDLTGHWLATVKAGSQTTTETYELTASPTWLNVFNVTGSVTGMVLETAKGKLNISTEGFPERSLAGQAKPTLFTAQGKDAAGAKVSLKATKQ